MVIPINNTEKNMHAAGTGRNARETAYQIIRDKIIGCELKPGEAISDKQLAEELQMSRTPVREALIILSTSNMVVMKPQTGTFVSPIDVHRMDTEQFARYALEKEIITRACGHITEEHRWLYEENLRTYRHYAELPSENRGKNLLRLDNEFHRIAFLAVGREENYRIQFGQLQHIERMRMLSLHFMGQETNVKDHTGLYQAIAEGDLKTTLERLEVHMGRYRENLAAVQERYPDYFSMS